MDITVDWIKDTMKSVVDSTRDLYSCNRPPGAAGALILGRDGGRVIAGVFPPEGSLTCKEVGCEIEYTVLPNEILDKNAGEVDALHEHCVRTIHAEQAVIAACARYGIHTDEAIMFSILKPCYQCSKLIIAAGIKKIYYAGKAYDEERTRKILENAGVECIHVDIDLEYGN